MDTLFWFLWFFNGTLAYFKVRGEERKTNGKWTRLDRLFWLMVCLFGGTIVLLILLVGDFWITISRTNWAKREARW